ncbi:hypothetical protein [Nonomuraea sp. bgisy101]|uniref:hypothetical protein n=1 Tax=Nonomuraea sp. bgisy101 TaxID=3413784 RepID=UPI003D75B12B
MADDTSTTTDQDTTDGSDQDPPATGTSSSTADDGLGDGGKKALDAERAARKEAEKRAREAEKKVKTFEDASKSDLDKATGRADAAEQRAQALIERTVRAEIKAAAADAFADPSDAAAFLAAESYVGDDGEIDAEQIKKDLADLLERKPHLAKAKRNGPKPDPSQGAKPGGTPNLATQIAEAKAKGDWRLAMRLENSKLAAAEAAIK